MLSVQERHQNPLEQFEQLKTAHKRLFSLQDTETNMRYEPKLRVLNLSLAECVHANTIFFTRLRQPRAVLRLISARYVGLGPSLAP
jgi:hypothetical protein